jgi:hypothetical protein
MKPAPETGWCSACSSRVPSAELRECRGTYRCGREKNELIKEDLVDPSQSESR